jgi:hypothetical protein
MIGQPHAPDAAEILVYSAKLPECPFEEIALISARQGELSLAGSNMDRLLTALKQRAHQLGGHAIVDLTERPRTKEEGPSLSGTIIRFTSSECRPNRGS